MIDNGNMTEWSPIQSVSIEVNKTDSTQSSRN